MADLVQIVADALDGAPEYGVRKNKANDARYRYEVFYLDENDAAVVVGAYPMSDLADSERFSLQREANAKAVIEAMREPTIEAIRANGILGYRDLINAALKST